MPQVKKDEVEERIRRGALRAFAALGWERATMGEVARAAGVSTGNLYRYFTNKEELFDAVLGDDFVAAFRELVRARVRAASGGDHAAAIEALLAFAIEHRLRVVVLLGRAKGSRHEDAAEDLVKELVALAEAHAGAKLSRERRFVLHRLYRNLVAITVDILAEHAEPDRIRAATAAFNAYHLAGLRAFLEAGDQPSRPDQRR